jgi:predicted membrane protein
MTNSLMTEHDPKIAPGSGVARALSLAVALAISFPVLVWPKLVVTANGSVDHGWLILLMWGIAAGFVHGVGFVPRNRLLRVALGPVVAWGVSLLAVVVFVIA